jgi:hypothetical protein
MMRHRARPSTRGWHTGRSELGQCIILAVWAGLFPNHAERTVRRAEYARARQQPPRVLTMKPVSAVDGRGTMIDTKPFGLRMFLGTRSWNSILWPRRRNGLDDSSARSPSGIHRGGGVAPSR